MDIRYKKGHISSLDGIRGCAILLVLFFHCLRNDIFPFSWISGIGWVGVDLFFVLSGFLITGILVDNKGGNNYLATFFLKRTLRIFPLYYLALSVFFSVLLLPNISSINPILDKRHFNDIFYYLTYTQNIRFSFNGWGVPDTLNHFWSLAIEEQFYLIWPFVIMLANRNKLLLISFFLVVFSLVTRNLFPSFPDAPFSYTFTLARMDALAIGSITAILIRRNTNFLNNYVLSIFTISVAVLSFVILYTKSVSLTNIHFIRYGYTFFSVLFASLIIFIFDTKRIGKVTNCFFDAAFLRFLGKYSYGIYIYHWLLYRGLYVYLAAKFTLSKIYVFPFLAFVILISVLSYHLYEKRFLKYRTIIDENTNWRQLLPLAKKTPLK